MGVHVLNVCVCGLYFTKYPCIHAFLFYSRLCPSTAGSSPPPEPSIFLSLVILVHTVPCCPTMSSLQRRLGLPTYLTPFVCHSVLLIVHLLIIIDAHILPFIIVTDCRARRLQHCDGLSLSKILFNAFLFKRVIQVVLDLRRTDRQLSLSN